MAVQHGMNGALPQHKHHLLALSILPLRGKLQLYCKRRAELRGPSVCHCHPQTIRYLLRISPSLPMSLTALNSRPHAAILSLFIAIPIPFVVYFQSLITSPPILDL